MAVQTTYLTENIKAIAGAIVDGQLKNERTGHATTAIPFGRFCAAASAVEGALKLVSATGEVTATGAGFAVRTQANVANASDVLQYEINDSVTFCDFGVMWVACESACAIGDPVLVRFAVNGGNTVIGGVRAGADTGAVALPGAYFQSVLSGAGLAKIKIRMVAGV